MKGGSRSSAHDRFLSRRVIFFSLVALNIVLVFDPRNSDENRNGMMVVAFQQNNHPSVYYSKLSSIYPRAHRSTSKLSPTPLSLVSCGEHKKRGNKLRLRLQAQIFGNPFGKRRKEEESSNSSLGEEHEKDKDEHLSNTTAMLPNVNSTDVINTTNSPTTANARYRSIFKFGTEGSSDKNNSVTEINVDDEAVLITDVDKEKDVVANPQESQVRSTEIPKKRRFNFLKRKKNQKLSLTNEDSVGISETVDTDNSMTSNTTTLSTSYQAASNNTTLDEDETLILRVCLNKTTSSDKMSEIQTGPLNMKNKTNALTKRLSRIRQSRLLTGKRGLLRNKVKYTALAALLLLAVPIPKRFNTVVEEQQQLEIRGADVPLEKQSRKSRTSEDVDYESQKKKLKQLEEAEEIQDERIGTGNPYMANNDDQNNPSPNPLYNNKYSAIQRHQSNGGGGFVAAAVRQVGPSVIRIDTETDISHQQMPQQPNSFQSPEGGDTDAESFLESLLEGFQQDIQQQPQSPQQRYTRRPQTITGQGSGIIFDAEGLVLTNAHVISGANRVSVTLTDGRRYTALTQGVDEMSDLAVLKIVETEVDEEVETSSENKIESGNPFQNFWQQQQQKRQNENLSPPIVPDSKKIVKQSKKKWTSDPLPVAQLGNSDTLQVGEFVIAVGNPIGLDNTVTMGIVSSLKRTSTEIGINASQKKPLKIGFIQTDAAINPGNSGGPLVNDAGEVIGINTCMRAESEGIGFAIPINSAKDIMYKLAKGESIEHGYIGISMTSLTPDFVRQNNAKVEGEGVGRSVVGIMPEVHGAIITKVMPNTPAANGGLRKFDIVIEIGGKRVRNAAEAQAVVDASKVGVNLSMKIIRTTGGNGGPGASNSNLQQRTVTVKPGDWNDRLREEEGFRQIEQKRLIDQQRKLIKEMEKQFGGGRDGDDGGGDGNDGGDNGRVYVFPYRPN